MGRILLKMKIRSREFMDKIVGGKKIKREGRVEMLMEIENVIKVVVNEIKIKFNDGEDMRVDIGIEGFERIIKKIDLIEEIINIDKIEVKEKRRRNMMKRIE